ncbi:conserved hypothetical protein [Theileria orientalis strain Shintoku]|uniref:Uncharacterized protein n=1 Tax=Theileria orientalis strain Shintoku TaxID=869250 RepID=J4D5Y1_THEOR|nr:conserved hypothetical protein [Theileria orientalis strain Shintoku]BAM39240.1 conserved hypothetical protein [Theileria orientalis strain Shintoku]|eukprot:XP_009689541.1 conserved hypothetical protein [Theileria orientalis strain Shintoku]
MQYLYSIFDTNILKFVNNKFSILSDFLAHGFGFGRIPALVNCGITAQTANNTILSPNSIIKDLIDGLNTLFWKGKHFKGTTRSGDQAQNRPASGRTNRTSGR